MIPPVALRRHFGAPAPRRARLRAAIVLLLSGVVLTALAGAAPAQPSGALVDVVEVEGIIDQTIADYITERIEQAEADKAEVVVLSLDTPGGLGVSMDEIIDTISHSEVPVTVWVGPSGAQAASAGMYIAYASHVLAMAPATTMGAATPVDLGGGDLDDKVRNASEAQLVALAEARGRDVEFARAAVRDGAVIAIGEVDELPEGAELPAGIDADSVSVVSADELDDRPVADFVAASLPDVLTALNGREVELTGPDGSGSSTTLAIDQTTANVRFNNLGLVRRVLHTVANPTLAYLLLISGALALLFEVFQPGFGVAGVSGLILIGLGLYGLSVLPVNWLAFALLVVGLVLLAVDLAVAGLGALTAGGTIALAAGSFLLFTSPVLRVSLWVIVPVVLFNLLFFVVIMTSVLRAQSSQAMLGAEGMQGKVGVVRSMLNPEGHIFVNGALWRARAPEADGKVKTGTKVRVIGLNDRLTLDVEVLDSDADADATPVG